MYMYVLFSFSLLLDFFFFLFSSDCRFQRRRCRPSLMLDAKSP